MRLLGIALGVVERAASLVELVLHGTARRRVRRIARRRTRATAVAEDEQHRRAWRDQGR
jgi:hypothetical protein